MTAGESLAERLAGGEGLPADDVLDVVGQVGFALQALHAQGRAHGDVTATLISLHPDGAITLEPAPPDVAISASPEADLAALGRVARDAAAVDVRSAIVRFLDRLADPPRGEAPEAGDVARTALAMRGGTVAEPIRADAPTVRAEDPPPTDPGQRRVRNRLIAVGAAVVLVGLFLLKACGGSALETVPDVRGDSVPAATSALHAHGLAVRERVVALPPGGRRGAVVAQSLAPGVRARAGTTVTVTVTR